MVVLVVVLLGAAVCMWWYFVYNKISTRSEVTGYKLVLNNRGELVQLLDKTGFFASKFEYGNSYLKRLEVVLTPDLQSSKIRGQDGVVLYSMGRQVSGGTVKLMVNIRPDILPQWKKDSPGRISSLIMAYLLWGYKEKYNDPANYKIWNDLIKQNKFYFLVK